jgi:hypothetical protein
MPIAVYLQNIDGARRLEMVVDPEWGLNKVLPMDDPSFPLLQYVDPYGETIFNPNQMPQIIEELERLMDDPSKREYRDLLARVRSLAIRCQGARHLYLRFSGD